MSLDLHKSMCDLATTVNVFCNYFMVADVSSKHIIVYCSLVLVVIFLFVEVPVNSHLHHVRQVTLVAGQTETGSGYKFVYFL